MLTEFGQELRMIRLAYGDRILNMAEKLGETPAFISKLERGAIVLPGGFGEKVIKAYQLNRRRADQVRLAFKRTFAKEKLLTTPDDKSYWYFWSAEEPYDKINENGPFATINDAITDAKSKIRYRETVFIFKSCWLVSDLNYHIFGFSSCEINSDAQTEEDDIFSKIEKRINTMSESKREAMRKSINLQQKMGQIFENTTKHEEPVAFCDKREVQL
ncbi:helix-turn-helix transcriptional regulator [uncultured Bartonella sp.]|uniref:helix-turn-helix domain-containing protein n=1 Tax=uncultured Bartonella sp. TaxID=104108 RepID=UPI0025D1E356|nr:helix-turn-helix transcriptional regulator [uncultured Bartonella sp.]